MTWSRSPLVGWKAEQEVDVCWYTSEDVGRNVPDVMIVLSPKKKKKTAEPTSRRRSGWRRVCNFYRSNPPTSVLFFISSPPFLLLISFLSVCFHLLFVHLHLCFSFTIPTSVISAFLVLFLLFFLLFLISSLPESLLLGPPLKYLSTYWVGWHHIQGARRRNLRKTLVQLWLFWEVHLWFWVKYLNGSQDTHLCSHQDELW